MTRTINIHSCLVTVVLAAGLVPADAFAEPFSWQVSGRYDDIDAQADLKTSRSSVRATYYLSSVNDQAGPYELAPFLNRSGFVAVATGRTKLREQLLATVSGTGLPGDGRLPDDAIVLGTAGGAGPAFGGFAVESGVDSSDYTVHGRYVWTGTGWYAGARARRGVADLMPQLAIARSTVEQDSTGVFAGKYFGARTTLEVDLGSDTVSQELQISPFGIGAAIGFPTVVFDLQTRTDTETENARLSVRHVGQLAGSSVALSASAGASRSESRFRVAAPADVFASLNPFGPGEGQRFAGNPDWAPGEPFESERERRFSLSGALFPTQALGVRLTFSNSDHDTLGSGDLVGLSANWFFVRNAAAQIELVRTSSRDRYPAGSLDSDSVSVRLLGRF